MTISSAMTRKVRYQEVKEQDLVTKEHLLRCSVLSGLLGGGDIPERA